MRRVVLVAGPPCAGKTTHVHQHARPGDLVLDQDAIGAAAMRDGLAHVTAMTDGTAWVIRCCPGPGRRRALAQQIHATDVVLLRPGDTELLDRAKRRPDPRRHIQAVRDWLRREAEDKPTRTTRGRAPDQRTTTERGLGWDHQQARAKALAQLKPGTPCPYCQLPMERGQKLDLDHAVPRVYGGTTGPRRLAHAGCNRRAGQAIAVARRHRRRSEQRRAVNSRAW